MNDVEDFDLDPESFPLYTYHEPPRYSHWSMTLDGDLVQLTPMTFKDANPIIRRAWVLLHQYPDINVVSALISVENLMADFFEYK